MDTKSLSDFTNLYPVSKTLRFELKPIGKTLEMIEKNDLLKQDKHRAESYKVVKQVIDHYHKHFIDEALRNLDGIEKEKFIEGLNNVHGLMGNNDSDHKKKMEKSQETLRKIIAKQFNTSRLFGKELIKEDLMNYLYECQHNGEELPLKMSIDECKSVVGEFEDFTSYFTGFHENRKNMYSSEEKSTAIAYRLIHENLPKFISNMTTWRKVNEKLSTQLTQLEQEMSCELAGKSLASYFEDLSSYAGMLTQSAITRYNSLIGGKSEDDKKIQGLNEYINLYNQKADRKDRLPKMTELYKMILSDREDVPWLHQQFNKDGELLEAVENFYKNAHETLFVGKENRPSLKQMLANLDDYDLTGIFIKNDTTLTSVVKQAYGDWGEMRKGLENAYNASFPQGKKSDEKYAEARKKWMDSFDSFSIKDICHYTGKDEIVEWYKNLGVKKDIASEKRDSNAFEKVESAYHDAKDLLNTEYRGNLKDDAKSIELLKPLLDSLKDLQRLASTLKGNGDESGRDGRFYSEWERNMVVLDQITPLYNMVRNYVTQKPYSEEKFKLNFNNTQLMSGWDQNKETDCLGILMRKEGMYYLGIMDKNSRKSFLGDLPCDGECYEKVDYKFFKDLTTMVPKCTTQLKSVKAHFNSSEKDYILENDNFLRPITITKEIFELNNKLYDGKKKFQVDYLRNSGDQDGFDKAVSTWIQFCYDFLASYRSTAIYNLDELKVKHYSQIDDYYSDINKQLYKLSFRPVSVSYIDKLVDEGKLYLFQIYNKDFSSFSKGTPNMHTLYWKALFSEENLKDVVYKLNGEAEVFFRRKSVTYDEKHLKEGYHQEKLKDKFSYPIYKDRRYSMDKFQFHVPITMNFKAVGRDYIDQQVREFAKAGGIKHIIGIDRGERHLLYLSMIDLNGNIVKQFTLNEIVNEYKGQTYKTNYHTLLDQKEDQRDKARKNWQTIEGIKDLKEGYLSQVVHIISQMMVEHQAIVVLEDLNFGFMRGRQKVEKQVYQKFEKMLIDKLNYLVDKKKPITETGGILHALQLTSKFESFQKLGKQSGFLFYVPAALTSKIDPVTGFANYISTKYESSVQAYELLKNFADIRYNKGKDYFEFVIDNYKQFNPKAVGGQQWVVCSHGNRIETFRNSDKNNEWDNRDVNPTEELKKLFASKTIDYKNNLLAQILLLKDDAKFLKEMLHLLGLVLQMRNSVSGTEKDYIISPVADEKGHFYCSADGDESLPKDADANGAYNIARKGLWAVMRIQLAPNFKEVKLAMTNEEWMYFAQEKPYKA